MSEPIRLPAPSATSPLIAPLAVGGPQPASLSGPGATGLGASGPSFQDVLLQSLNQVNDLDRQSQSAIASGLTESELTQAEVFAAVKKADLALRTMLQIRNKLLDAYNEIKQIRM